MVLIGSFYIMTTFLGFGAATIVGRDFISTHGGTNMSAPLLAQALAGNIFFAFISAIAFATILAVVAGLTISASTSFAHDLWTNVIHKGVERKPGEEVMVARISAFVVGAVAITHRDFAGSYRNVAFLVALAFAVAASANLPVIVLSIFWRRFNTTGAVAGLAVGLLASIGLILIGPSLMAVDPPTVTGAARHLIQAKALVSRSRIPASSASRSDSRCDPRYPAQPRTQLGAQVQRTAGALQHRTWCRAGGCALARSAQGRETFSPSPQ